MAELLEILYWSFKELQFHFYHKPFFHRSLARYYSFYKRIDDESRKKFLRLVMDHYDFFEFVPRGTKVTRLMKTVISAGAAHVVFNLPEESLSYYTRIFVYADNYPSKLTGKMHKGEVNPGLRLIVFSWRGIVEGLKKEEGINLMLHEFAHALWLEHKLRSDAYSIFDSYKVQEFERLAENEMARLSADENHFFRKYAFENIHEFFAVAVENFFERPKQFQEAMPHFYDVCKGLFKQNPIQYHP